MRLFRRRPSTSVENRLVALNLWKSPTPLSDLLDEFGTDSFSSFVEYRLREFPADLLQDSAMNHWAEAEEGLGISESANGPDTLQNWEQFMRVSGTMKARHMVDPSYWSGPTARTCTQSLLDVIEVVDEQHPIPWSDEVSLRAGSRQEQSAFVSLFLAASDLYAALASESRMIRRHIGLKKGVFN